MSNTGHHLHIVPPPPPAPAQEPGRGADVALLAVILAVAVSPFAATLAGLDRWGDATLGTAVAVAMWSATQLAALVRAGGRP